MIRLDIACFRLIVDVVYGTGPEKIPGTRFAAQFLWSFSRGQEAGTTLIQWSGYSHQMNTITRNVGLFFLGIGLVLCSRSGESAMLESLSSAEIISGWPHHSLSLSDRTHHARLREVAEGTWELTTTGNDPYIFVDGFTEVHDPDVPYVVAFEYQLSEECGDLMFYYSTSDGVKHTGSHIEPSDKWAWFLHDLSREGRGLGRSVEWFRIDFGNREGADFSIRNLRLVKASKQVRLRANLGDKADRIDTFGISLPDDAAPRKAGMETVRHSDSRSVSVVMSLYRHLDFDALSKLSTDVPSARAPVPRGPRLVAGEGEDPENHTVVRILSDRQVCEAQFLAFPPEIRGGVGVETGAFFGEECCIAAWPLACERTRELRIFNSFGGLLGVVSVSDELVPPFSVCAGDLTGERPGDEIAVVSRRPPPGDNPVLVYDASGQILRRVTCPWTTEGAELALLSRNTPSGDVLLLQDLNRKTARQLMPETGDRTLDFSDNPGDIRLFDSAFDDRVFNAGGSAEHTSTLFAIGGGGVAVRRLDVGRMENVFWFYKQKSHGGSRATWKPVDDGRYIRNGLYNFLGGAMYWSPLLGTGEIEDKSYAEWTDRDWDEQSFLRNRKKISEYDTGVPTVWSPVFTHRWHTGAVSKISSKRDPETGLPVYLLLDRKNDPTGGGYFGKRLFDYGSQNFEQEALNRFYTYCQREFLRRLAVRYRRNPEMTIAVEPNHENEIVSGAHSVGDYNPANLRGFHHYLTALYGDLDNINRIFQTGFTEEFFDAPRGILRGNWDRYHVDNPLFAEWVEYNRVVIYRRVGTSYLQAMHAGFPPELIKCHQIPSLYVFGSIVGISEGQIRISPIDWLLTHGAGFGFSRYGTYYEREHNIGQGAHSSGADGMLIGEYASLNPSTEKALGQLRYLRDHGVAALHVMWWPEHLDKGFNIAQDQALRQLVAEHDSPRPGYAGGISGVRAYSGPAGTFDIAGLGTRARHTGLIKSLRKDGIFEGTVYVVPFHAHVDVRTLCEKPRLRIAGRPTALCEIRETRQGAFVEITFTIQRAQKQESLQLSVTHRNVILSDRTVTVDRLTPGKYVRIGYRIPLILGPVSFNISANAGQVDVKDLKVYLHQEQTINLTKKIMHGTRHRGGVTFDVLDRPRTEE